MLLFCLLLFDHYRFEHGFLHVGFKAAARGIDDRIERTEFKLGILLLHAVFGRVITKRDVAGQHAKNREGVVGFIDNGGRHNVERAQAGVEDDLISLVALDCRPSIPYAQPRRCMELRSYGDSLIASQSEFRRTIFAVRADSNIASMTATLRTESSSDVATSPAPRAASEK